MFKGLRTYLNRAIVFILLVNTLIIIANSVVNTHVHFLANGMVVEHSHPYSHDHDGGHSTHKHTKYELYHFNLLSHFLLVSSQNTEAIVEVNREFLFVEIDEVYSCFTGDCFNKSPPC